MRTRWFVYGIVATIMGVAVLTCSFARADEQPNSENAATAFAQLFPDAVAKVMPSVVSIQTTKKMKRPELELPFDYSPFDAPDWFMPDRRRSLPRERTREYTQRSLGSGFVIRQDGWIATNYHVVRDVEAKDIKVIFSEPQDGGRKEFNAVSVSRDPNTDMAVVKIEAGGLKALPLGDSSSVRPGEWVIAVGSPLGFGNSVTAGIISATTTRDRLLGGEERGSLAASSSQFATEDYLQTDAAINMGNSGGPLVNLRGEVIGVNTLIVSPTGGSVGLGFAIPSNIVKKIQDELINKGKVTRGYLGVRIMDMSKLNDDAAQELFRESSADKVRELYHIKAADKGALVGEVMEDSPAQEAGIELGDLIQGIDGKEVAGSSELKSAIELKSPGNDVTLKVQRKGDAIELKVAIRQQPTGEEGLATAEGSRESERLGMSVQEITPAIARALGLDKAEGVVVTDVADKGPADKAGIEANDVILRVGKKQITKLGDFEAAVEETAKEKTVALFVKRGDEAARWVELKP